ncbi:MAG: serine/threonine-protein kinase [Planctomycetota bacterium]
MRPCPESWFLKRAAAGDIETSELDDLTEHMEVCSHCQARFDEFLLNDSEAMMAVETVPAITDNALTRLLERMKRANHWQDQPELGSRFEVIRRLGQGGMGEVFECIDRKLSRTVAIKKIKPDHLTPKLLERLNREAQIQARLNHPNIVQIYEIGLIAGVPFIAMEHVPGGSMNELLAQKPLAQRTAAQLVSQVARAVHHAHGLGVLHRDIKPSNILLTSMDFNTDSQAESGPAPKIADFGLAKLLHDSLDLSKSNVLVGTPAYISPEQASGRLGQMGPAADIYSLGVVLYESLTGHPPFNATSVGILLAMVEGVPPVAPSKLVPGISKDLETICMKCLEKEPGRRYASSLDMAEDLERYLEGKPILARPAGPVRQLAGWCGRNKELAGAIATVIMLSVALFSGSIYFGLTQAELKKVARMESERSKAMAKKAEMGMERARNLLLAGIGRLSNITGNRAHPPTDAMDLKRIKEHEIKSFDSLVDQFVNDPEMVEKHEAEATMFLFHSANLAYMMKDIGRFGHCIQRIMENSLLPAYQKYPLITFQLMAYKMLCEYYETQDDTDKSIETLANCWSWMRSLDFQTLPADANFRQNSDWISAKYQELLRQKGWEAEAEKVARETTELNKNFMKSPTPQMKP